MQTLHKLPREKNEPMKHACMSALGLLATVLLLSGGALCGERLRPVHAYKGLVLTSSRVSCLLSDTGSS